MGARRRAAAWRALERGRGGAAPHNRVTLIVSQAEIGQGISTTLAAILADELGADWDKAPASDRA